MAFYDKFPYTNFQELNLDWITQEVSKVRDNRDASDASAAAALASEQAAKASETEAAASAQASAGSAESAAEDASRLEGKADQVDVNTARIDNILVQGTPTEGNAELIDIRVAADGRTYTLAGDAVRGQADNLKKTVQTTSQATGFKLEENNFRIGAYSTSGIVSNTSRAYVILTGVSRGSMLFWDASKWEVNYYYLTSETDFTPLYTPNIWDTTGILPLDYMDNGIVFIAIKTAENTSLTSRLNEINESVYILNNTASPYVKYNGIISGTTLAENNKIGFYTVGGFSTQIVSQLTDMPVTDFGGGFLFNTYVGAAATSMKQTLIEIDTGIARGRTFTRLIGSSWYGTGNINWVAFGDSITHGSYSNSKGATLNNPKYSYAYRIAKAIRRDDITNFYNCGVRGIGWINTGNNGETFSDMMDLFEGDKTSINLVTIMLGINDYNSRETLGTTESEENDGTISGAIRYGLRYLCENYPNAKIVAISPLNSMNHGNASNGWSRNTRIPNAGTLQQVCDMIAYWCNVYNVTYINEISESFLNNYNMPTFLGDNLHPTDAGQWMLAYELSKKIFI